ncbi:MAG TPA: diguanylate cyclase [Gammaproteobacteria bacterium]|nr:diguanylate cyclase [Gammaproteobacteria bacterium]
MPLRALQPDEEIVPLAQPKPAGRPVRAIRPLADSDTVIPLGQTQPNTLPAHTPSLSESLLGREDPGGTANVAGVLPSLGEHLATTGKEIGNLFMQGGVNAADVALTAQKPLLDWYLQRDQAARDRGQQQQEELLSSGREMFTPAQTTPVGDVLGGLAGMALPLAGGVPGLVASETLRRGKELLDENIDLPTAQKLSVLRGATTYAGAKLPIVGKTAASRVLTGAGGNVALNAADQQQEKDTLRAAAPTLSPEEQAAAGATFESDQPPTAEQHQALAKAGQRGQYMELADKIPAWWDPKARITDLLMGAGFGGLHHVLQAPVDRANAQVEAARAAAEHEAAIGDTLARADAGVRGAQRPPSSGGAAQNPAEAFYDSFTQEGQETPRLHTPESFERRNDIQAPEPPPPNDGTLPAAGTVTRTPADRSPIEQETELERMGLTPDVIGNLIKLEDEGDAKRAGRVLPKPETPAPPVPDEAAQAAQRERYAGEAAQERTGKIAAERRGEIGLTPDVQANLARMQARGAVGASVPPIADVVAPVTDKSTPTADQGVTPQQSATSTVQTPKKVRPLRQGEEIVPLSATEGGKAPAAGTEHAIESVQPGEKGLKRQRQDKAVKKWLQAKRPPPSDPERLISYRTEATLGYNLAHKAGAAPDVLDALRRESEWAHEQLAATSPGTLESLGVDAKGRNTRAGGALEQTEPQGKSAKSAKPQSVLEHLAHHGGVSIDALEAEGIDRADMRSVKGFKRPFTKKGMSLDAAAEKLHEAGYPVADEGGRPDANKALALIDSEVRHGTRTLPKSASAEAPVAAQERRGGEEARTAAERRAPPPRETPDRRGVVGERRKPVGEMSHEEMRSELLTSHLTGLANRRAYDERPRMAHQGSIDVDSLKWVNDNMSHGSGDELLKAVGQALKEAAGDRAYHFSGDEFAIEGKDAAELHELMERVNERLAQATIEITKADGSVVTLDGLGVSYGLGETLDAADQNLSVAKQTREAQGVRAARGEKPVGATVRGGGDEGGPDQQGNAPAGVKEPGADEYGSEQPAEHEPGDVEHVTLTGEGHVAHTERGGGEHVQVGEGRAGVKEGGELTAEQQSIKSALREVEDNPTAPAKARVRKLLDAYKAEHGNDATSELLDRLDAERELSDEHPVVHEQDALERDSQELGDALRAAHEANPEDTAPHSAVRKLMARFERKHGTEALDTLIDKLDKELDLEPREIRASKAKPPAMPPRNPPEQGDLFTQDDARPGTTAKQIAAANAILKELEDAAASDEEHDIKSLAVSFNREFKTDHTASLIGKTITATGDLATLSEVFRDAKTEILRYFLTDKGSGRIIAQTGVGSRLPGSGAAYPAGESMEWVGRFIAKHPGAELWMQHNHPGGFARPSTTDVALTANIARRFKINVRHVVIDHDHYGRIMAKPDGEIISNEIVHWSEKANEPDPLHTPSKPHPLLGRSLTGPGPLIQLAKELEQKGAYVTVIGTGGAYSKVKTLGDMPSHLFSNPERLKQQLRRFAVQNGSAQLFIAGIDPEHFRSSESRRLFNELQYDGYAMDFINTEGHSFATEGGGIIRKGQLEHGVDSHLVAREVKPREPDTRTEKQVDAFNAGAEARNKLAAEERSRDAKRNPNKDVNADTGRPGDLFTRHKQLDLVKDVVPHRKLLERQFEAAKKELEKLTTAEIPGTVDEPGGQAEADARAEQSKKIRAAQKRMNDLAEQITGHKTRSLGELADEIRGLENRRRASRSPKRRNELADEISKLHDEENDTVEETPGQYGERRADQRRTVERGGRREGDEDKSQKGDKGYAAVAQKALNAWNKRVGWRYGPLGRLPAKERYLEQRYKALGKVTESQEIARGLYDALHKATPEDSAAVYEYLTNKDGEFSTIKDRDIRAIAKTTKNMIDQIGQRLVNAGLLSQEAYDEHKGEYLPRLYLKHMLGESVMSAIGSGKRMSDLGYLKRRQDIPEEVRKVVLGEITDPAFLASFGISRTLRDLALHDFLQAIAGREQWTPRHSTVEWRGRQVTPFYLADEARALRKRAALYQDGSAKAAAFKLADEAQAIADEGLAKLEARPDPNDFEQIPNSRRYGALRGLYVRKEIYGDLVGAQQWIPANSSIAEQLLGSGGLMARAQSWWKLSKVILNPPTQVRNFIANMVLLHLSGVPFHRVYSGEIVGKAINSIAKKDRFYQIAKKYGLFSATFANTEGARIRDEWLALQDMKGGGLAKLRAFAGRGVNAASDFYQLMEAIGKIAKIRDAIEREGKEPAAAVLEAHEALFDYSLVPRSVGYLRNAPVGAPFITFAYKAAAQMAKIAIKHPARFAPYVAIPFLMASLIKNAYDVTDDDLKKLREALPKWMKERGHMLLLPYKDALGRWQVVDLGYLAPWGQFADLYAAAEQGKGVKELAGSLAFSGPMMDVANAIQTGVDPFTGKEIVNPADPPADRLQQMMQYAWNLAAPGWLTEQGALNQLRKSVTGNNLNKRTGEPGMTPTQASLRLLGLNVYPADPTATRAANLRSMRANLEESKARASELLRNKNLSDSEREKIRATWQKLLEARGKEIELYSRGSEINPKLQ